MGSVEARPVIAHETVQAPGPGRICAELDRGIVPAGGELPGVFQQDRADQDRADQDRISLDPDGVLDSKADAAARVAEYANASRRHHLLHPQREEHLM
jgi:hypothetical protein